MVAGRGEGRERVGREEREIERGERGWEDVGDRMGRRGREGQGSGRGWGGEGGVGERNGEVGEKREGDGVRDCERKESGRSEREVGEGEVGMYTIKSTAISLLSAPSVCFVVKANFLSNT